MLRQVGRDGALFQVFIDAVAFGADMALQRVPELRMARHEVAIDEAIPTAQWTHEAATVTDVADMRGARTVGVAIPAGDAAWCRDFARLSIGDADEYTTSAAAMPEAAWTLDVDTFRRASGR